MKFVLSLLNNKQKKQFFVIIALTFVSMIAETLSVVSVLPLIEVFFNDPNNVQNNKFNAYFLGKLEIDNLHFYVVILAALAFSIKGIFLTYFNFKKNDFLFNFKTFISEKLFLSYLYKPFSFHMNTNSAQLIRNLNDSGSVTVFVRTVIELVTETLILFGLSAFLLYINYELTILCFLFFGIIGFIFHKITQIKASEWGEIRRYRSGLKLEDLQKGFGAIRDIKLLGKEKVFSNFFSKNLDLENVADMKNTNYMSLPKIWFEWLTLIMILLVIIYLEKIQMRSDIIVIMGLLALCAFRLVPSVVRIMNSLQQIKFVTPAIKPFLNDVKDLEMNKISKYGQNKKKINLNKSIKLENLNFKFPNNKDLIIDNLNLEIKKNSFIGIYGESGVGKTTFVNILLGLLTAKSGKIYIDDFDISKDINSWQNLISYIPQNVFISDDTIKNNVALGEEKESIDMSRLNESFKLSRIYDYIYSLPDKINTNCGELGEKLSGGQRQRIGISRALYRNSEVLIFDEFTNFLDQQNELMILNDVKNMNNKTRIIVSHNLKVLKYCDEVYEMKNKKLNKSNLN